MPRDSRVNAREEKGGGGQVELDSEGRERERERIVSDVNRWMRTFRKIVCSTRMLTRCFTNFAPPSINVFILSFRRVPFPRNRCTLFSGEKDCEEEKCAMDTSFSLPPPNECTYVLVRGERQKERRERKNETALESSSDVYIDVWTELGLAALSSWISLTFIALVFYSTNNLLYFISDKSLTQRFGNGARGEERKRDGGRRRKFLVRKVKSEFFLSVIG